MHVCCTGYLIAIPPTPLCHLKGCSPYDFKSQGQGQGHFYFFVLIFKGVSENDVGYFFDYLFLSDQKYIEFFNSYFF